MRAAQRRPTTASYSEPSHPGLRVRVCARFSPPAMGRYYDNNACILCCLAVASIKSQCVLLSPFLRSSFFCSVEWDFVPHLPTTPLQSYTPAALQVRDRCEKRKPEEQFILRQLALTMICFQPSLRPKSGGRRRCQKWIPANIKIKMSCKQTATVPSGL